jgi:cytochrome o ubiquinol oxidase subunit II
LIYLKQVKYPIRNSAYGIIQALFMSKRAKILLSAILIGAICTFSFMFLRGANIDVLEPKGTVAAQQKDLLITATLLMLIVVIPVFILTFAFAVRYREGNTKAKYSPELDGHRLTEIIWWTIPFIIILILAGITWRSSHSLDPFKPLEAQNKPLRVQVVALQWKWLFIYPDQKIASVNYLQFPENTPINFEITSDAPMNSFWIPQLGGQVYAMSGMTTRLSLMADNQGTYDGSSANLSGEGFADMKFTASSTSQAAFDDWVRSTTYSSETLSEKTYTDLAKPAKSDKLLFAVSDTGIYDKIVMKYMEPNSELNSVDRSDSYRNEEEAHHH